MRPIKPPRLKDTYWIKLEPHQVQHGIQLTSDANSGVVICNISRNSAESADDRPQKGDVILQINDVSVEKETADFTRQLLQSFSHTSTSISMRLQKSRDPTQTLHVDPDVSGRRGHPSPVISESSGDNRSSTQERTRMEYVKKWTKVHAGQDWGEEQVKQVKCSIVHLVQGDHSGLGIDLCEADRLQGGEMSTDRKYVIQTIREGSPAHRDGRLRPGQRVLAINGKLLTACNKMEIDQLLEEQIVQLAVDSNDTVDLSELPPPISPDDIILLPPPFCDGDLEDQVGDNSDSHVITTINNREFTDLAEVVDSENSHISVVLRKKVKGKGLGFSVVGGVDTPQGAMGIHIKTLYPSGLAAECGLLRPGDEIVSVNGQSLGGLRHQEAVDLFKGLKRGTVVIRAKKRYQRTRLLCEEENNLSENRLPVHLQNDKRSVWTEEGILIQEIKLYKDPVLGLGFDVTANTESDLLKVTKIAKGTSADLCKRIRLGDELLKINSLHLKNYKRGQAIQLLNNIPAGPVTLKTRRETQQKTPKEADDNLQPEPPSGYIQQLSGSLLLENYLDTAQRYENGVINEGLDLNHSSSEITDIPHCVTPNHFSSNDLHQADYLEFDPNVIILPLPDEFQDGNETSTDCCSESDSVSTLRSRSSKVGISSPCRQKPKQQRACGSVIDIDDILIEFDPRKEEKWIQKVQEEKMDLVRQSRSRAKSAAQVYAEGVKKQEGGVSKGKLSDHHHAGISASLVAASVTAVALSRVSKVGNNKNVNQSNCLKRREGDMGRVDDDGAGDIGGCSGDVINTGIMCGSNKSNSPCCTIDNSLTAEKDSWSGGVDRATGGASHSSNSGHSGSGEVEYANEGRENHVTEDSVTIEEPGQCESSGQDSSIGVSGAQVQSSVEISGSVSKDREIKRDSVKGDRVYENVIITATKGDPSKDSVELKNKEKADEIIQETLEERKRPSVEKDMAQNKARNVWFVQQDTEDTDSIDSSKLRRKRTRQDKIEVLVIQRLPGEKLGMGINIESRGDESDYIRAVYVENVSPGGAADKAVGGNHGVCVGDEILEMNGVSLQEATYLETVNFFKELPLRITLRIRRRPLALRLASQKKKDVLRRNSDKDKESAVNNSERNSEASDSGTVNKVNKTSGHDSCSSEIIFKSPTEQMVCDVSVHNEPLTDDALLSQLPDSSNKHDTSPVQNSAQEIDSEHSSSGVLLSKDPTESSSTSTSDDLTTVLRTSAGLRDSSSRDSASGLKSSSSDTSSDGVALLVDGSYGTATPMVVSDQGEDIIHDSNELSEPIIGSSVYCSSEPLPDVIEDYRDTTGGSGATINQDNKDTIASCRVPDLFRQLQMEFQMVELKCQALEEPGLVELSENIELCHCQVDHISPTSLWNDVIHPGDILVRFDGTSLEGLAVPRVKHVICGGGGGDVIVSVFRRLDSEPRNIHKDNTRVGLSNGGGSVTCGKDVFVSGIKAEKISGIGVADSEVGFVKKQEERGIKLSDLALSHDNTGHLKEEKDTVTSHHCYCVAGGLTPADLWLKSTNTNTPPSQGLHYKAGDHSNHHHHLLAQSRGQLALENRSFRCKKFRLGDCSTHNNRTTGKSKSVPASPRKCQCLHTNQQRTLSKDWCHLLQDPLDTAWADDRCYCGASDYLGHSCPVTLLESGYCSLDKHRQGLVCEALHSVKDLEKEDPFSICDVTAPRNSSDSFTGGYSTTNMDRDIQEVPPLSFGGPPGTLDIDPPPLPGTLPPPAKFVGHHEEAGEALDIDDCILCCDSENEAGSASDSEESVKIDDISIFSNNGSVVGDNGSDQMGDITSFFNCAYKEEIPAPVITPNLVADNYSFQDKETSFQCNTKPITDADSLVNLSHNFHHAAEESHHADDVSLLSETNPSVPSQERPEPLGGYDKTQYSPETGTAAMADCYPDIIKISDGIGDQESSGQQSVNQTITSESHITDQLTSNSASYVSSPPNYPCGTTNNTNNTRNSTTITEMDHVNLIGEKQQSNAVQSELEFCTTSECNYTAPQHNLQSNGVMEIDSSLQAVAMPENSSAVEAAADKTRETPGGGRDANTKSEQRQEAVVLASQNVGHSERSSSSTPVHNSNNNSRSDVSPSIHNYHHQRGGEGEERVNCSSISSSSSGVGITYVGNNELHCNHSHVSGDGSTCDSNSSSCDSIDENSEEAESVNVTKDKDEQLREDMYRRSPVSSLMSATPGAAGTGKRYSHDELLGGDNDNTSNGTVVSQQQLLGDDSGHKGPRLWGDGHGDEKKVKNQESDNINSGASFVKQDQTPPATLAQENSSATLINAIHHRRDLDFQSTATTEAWPHSTEINRNVTDPAACTGLLNRDTQVVVNGKSSQQSLIENNYTTSLNNKQLVCSSNSPEGNTLPQQPLLYDVVGNNQNRDRATTTKGAIDDCVVKKGNTDKAHTYKSHGYVHNQPLSDNTSGDGMWGKKDKFITGTTSGSQGVHTNNICFSSSSESVGVRGHTKTTEISESSSSSIKPSVLTRTKSDSGAKPPLPPKPKHLASLTAVKSASSNHHHDTNKQQQGGEVNPLQGRDYYKGEQAGSRSDLQSAVVKQQTPERNDTAVPIAKPPPVPSHTPPTNHPSYLEETDQLLLALDELPSQSQGSLDYPSGSELIPGNHTEGDDVVDMLSRRVLLSRSASSASSSGGGDGRGSTGGGDQLGPPKPRPQMLLSAPRRVSGSGGEAEDSEADDISQSGKQPLLGEPWGVKLRSYSASTGVTEDSGPGHGDSDVISGVKLVAEVEKSFGGLGVEITVKDSTAVVTSLKANTPVGNLGKLRVGDIVLGVNKKPLSGLNNIRVQQLLRLLPTGPVKLDILRERIQQATLDTFDAVKSTSYTDPVIQKPLDALVDYVGEPQPTGQRYQEKRIPPKPKEKPKVALPKSGPQDTVGYQTGEKVDQFQYNLGTTDTADVIDSSSVSDSTVRSTGFPEYKYSPRTPPDGTDQPEDTAKRHLEDANKPRSNLNSLPSYVPEGTTDHLKEHKIPSGFEKGVVANLAVQNSLCGGDIDVKENNTTRSLGRDFDIKVQTKPNGEEVFRSKPSDLQHQANSSSVSADQLPAATVKVVQPEEGREPVKSQKADTVLGTPLEVVSEEIDMEVETSPRDGDDFQGVPRTSRSGSLKSANRESIIESMERKRRESMGSRLKGLQLPPSGLKKPTGTTGGVVTDLPTLMKPVVMQGLLPKPRERRSSYTALMPTSLGTKDSSSSINGTTPFKATISTMEIGKPKKSPAVFKVPAPVSSDRNYSVKKTVPSMSRSYSEDINKSRTKEFSVHEPVSSSDTRVHTTNHNNHSVEGSITNKKSDILDSNTKDSRPTLDNTRNFSAKKEQTTTTTEKDTAVFDSSESVTGTHSAETFETFGMPPVVNMNTFPPTINRDTLPLQGLPVPPPVPAAAAPVTRELSLEIDTITEAPRHTIRLPSAKSPTSRSFFSSCSSEYSPNKDANLNDSVLTAGSSLQSLDTTDTDSLPCSSSPKKGDDFVSPPSPLGVSKEDISEGRGSLVSTPDLDLDAPRSPTLSESDSGIFSAKLELKKDTQSDKYKNLVEQGPRSRISTNSSHSSSNSSSTELLSKTPDSTTTTKDLTKPHRTRLSQSSDTPKFTETSISYSSHTTSTIEDQKKPEKPKSDNSPLQSASDNDIVRETSVSSYTSYSSKYDSKTSPRAPSLPESAIPTDTTTNSNDPTKVSSPEKPKSDNSALKTASDNDKIRESSVSSYSSYSSKYDSKTSPRAPRLPESAIPSNTTTNSNDPAKVSRSERLSTSSYKSSSSYESSTSSDIPPRSPSALTPRSDRVRYPGKSTNEISPRSASTNETSPRSTSANEISPKNNTSTTNHISPRSTISTNEISPRSTSTNELSPRSTSSVTSREEESTTTKPGLAAEAVTSPTVEGVGVMDIEMVKGAIGLGFCIEGGIGSPKGDMPVLVKRMFKGTSAAQGKLQAGDEIMKVNGMDISHMSHYLAWNHLKSLPEGTIQMTIRRK